MKIRIIITGLFLAIALLAFNALHSNAAINPVFIAGNPSCVSLGYDFGFKVDPPDSGTYDIDGFNTVTVSNDGVYFDWSSTLSMDAVIAKGGPNANLFVYEPPAESFGDTGLHSPINPSNGNPYGLSHIEFCYDYELTVSKTAQTTFTRTFEWDIEKTVAPDTLDMFTGDSGEVEYTVTVDKTGYTDSNWAANGTITIDNNTAMAATITGVTDVVSPAIAATVNCGVTFPHVLAAGGTLECTYSTALPDGTDRTNTATVTTSGTVGGGSGTADVIFGDPTTLVNDTINVSDSVEGDLGSFSDDGSTTYTRIFTCDDDEGQQDNTATIVETGQSDDASVTVNCYALTVTKDASTSLTRTWDWDITKTADASYDLFSGDTQDHPFTVTVNKTGSTDSDFAVSGDISVYNPAPMAAELTGVADIVSPDIAATVSCGVAFPYTLAAGGTLNCTYSADLPDASDRTNTATATLQNYAYDSDGIGTASGTTDFTGSANVSFAGATVTEVNTTVTVTDTNDAFGADKSVSDDDSWDYEVEFACDADEGTHTNTATVIGDGDTELDSASVDVTIVCWDLTVTKDADTSLTRTYTWDIDKIGDQTDLTLSVGQSFTVNYDVTVSATYQDSNWAVSGDIAVNNPAPIDATINSVADIVSPAIAATVNCGVTFPHTLAAGGTLNCTYSTALPDASDRTNTATATLQNYDYDSQGNGTASGTTDFSHTVNVSFAAPTVNAVDECIDVTDDQKGDLGTVCAGDAPFTFEYTMDVGPYAVCGTDTFVNVASFATNDTGATGSDDHTVNVNVPCAGCTLTPGYWKTHSIHGPARYDDAWLNLGDVDGDGASEGADETFFQSGQTYYQVLWTSPQGDPYYILARAYIAAKLNILDGASSTGDVNAAMTFAETFFSTAIPGTKLSKAEREQVISSAATLDNYNNGLIGPGHCSE